MLSFHGVNVGIHLDVTLQSANIYQNLSRRIAKFQAASKLWRIKGRILSLRFRGHLLENLIKSVVRKFFQMDPHVHAVKG